MIVERFRVERLGVKHNKIGMKKPMELGMDKIFVFSKELRQKLTPKTQEWGDSKMW